MRRDDTGVTDVFYMNFAEAQLPPTKDMGKDWFVRSQKTILLKSALIFMFTTDNVNLAKLFIFPDSKLF